MATKTVQWGGAVLGSAGACRVAGAFAEGGGDAAAPANNPLANMTAFNLQNDYIGELTEYGEAANQFWFRFARPFAVARTKWLLRASLPINAFPAPPDGDRETGVAVPELNSRGVAAAIAANACGALRAAAAVGGRRAARSDDGALPAGPEPRWARQGWQSTEATLYSGPDAAAWQGTTVKRSCSMIAALFVAACAPEEGSVRWCQVMDERPKSEWSLEDGLTYAKYCLVSDLAIGSEKWCEKLEDKPKGDWTADEVASYARHCVMKMPKQADSDR